MEPIHPALPRPNHRAEVLAYAAACVLALGLAFVALRLWRADLTIPLAYREDSFAILTWTKTLLDNGWWMTNPYLGAPSQLEMHDYPTNCNLHFAVLKCLSLVTSDAATLVNLYFLLSFPLVALAALAALRNLGVARPVAVVSSILYAFLPYHFWRGESHLFLTNYYMVPLVCLVVIWLGKDEPFLIVRNPETGRLKLELRSLRAIASVLICLAVGCDFPYYPVFAAVLLLLAGAYSLAVRFSTSTLARTIVLFSLIAASFLGNMSPSFMYWWKNGRNLSPEHTAKRPWTDGEAYSLTVTQLLLPVEGHRLPLFKGLRDKFYTGTKLASEMDAMALGAVGSLGFLLALGALVCCHRADSERGRLYHLLGLLIAFAIFICTTGGFGTAFNLVGIGIMRCYNRASIFIGFLSLAALSVWLDARYRRYAQGRWGFACANVGFAILLALGLLDQTGKNYLAPFAAVKEEYRNDADFVAQIERCVPMGGMVFQLPYVSFLSYRNACHQMVPYSHFRGYLHSHTLRWSFGAMHGRYGDNLHARLAGLPLELSLRELAYLGFDGVFVDRLGYPDAGKQLETELRGLLRTEPIISRNQRFSFFRMNDFKERLMKDCSEGEWQQQHDRVYYYLQTQWTAGFFMEEVLGPDHWRWCGKDGTLEILNPSDHPKRVSLRFLARSDSPGTGTLGIHCSLFTENLSIDRSGTPWTKIVEIPPGRTVVHFQCTATPSVYPSRTIVFGLFNFHVEEIAPEQQVVDAAQH
ncbi:MAG TPA: hypothetical protein VKU02_28220 [Gemmataceae bacterium]|nr:hypothetical protein [Gemmataceae bacterium]